MVENFATPFLLVIREITRCERVVCHVAHGRSKLLVVILTARKAPPEQKVRSAVQRAGEFLRRLVRPADTRLALGHLRLCDTCLFPKVQLLDTFQINNAIEAVGTEWHLVDKKYR